MELRPLYKGSKGKWEWHKGRCQEEKKKKAVKMNKCKTRLVSNWRCRGQAGVMKALQRVVWSLIFFGFGVHLVKAEEQGSQVKQRMSERDLYQVLQVDVPWMRKNILQWETCEGRRVEEGKDPRTLKEPVEWWRAQKSERKRSERKKGKRDRRTM